MEHGPDPTRVRCPFVGLADDQQSRFSFPHPAHRCFGLRRPKAIAPPYQTTFCLTPSYAGCTIYRRVAAGGGQPVVARGADVDAVARAGTAPAERIKPPATRSPVWLVAGVSVLLVVAAVLAYRIVTAGGGLMAGSLTTTPEPPVAVATAEVPVTPEGSIAPDQTIPSETLGTTVPGGTPTATPAPTGAASALPSAPPSASTSASPPASPPSPSPSPSGGVTPSPQAASPSPTVGVGFRRYTVQPGDSLSRIALRYGTSIAEIARLNSIKERSIILVGQQLIIPRSLAPSPSPT